MSFYFVRMADSDVENLSRDLPCLSFHT